MLQSLAFIFVLMLFIPDAYIYWLYIRKWNKAQWVRLLWWMPSVILAAGFIGARYIGTQNPMSERQSIIAWLGIFILCIGVPKLIFMLIDLIGRILHAIIKPISMRWFAWLGTILAVGFFGIAFYGSTLGLSHFQVKEVTYTSSRLPQGFDGYRIVQISDIHSGSFKDRPGIIKEMVKLVNEQQGDVVFFTGDLVNQRSKELDQFVDVLSQLHAPDGVYSILGNHDYGRYFRWAQPGDEESNQEHLEKQQFNMGWKFLKNQHDILYRNNDSIAVIGVENDGNPPFPQYADLPKASEGTEGMFRILLSHDPTHWRREVLPTTDIDLMLSGHTHGAQFMLFGWSPASWIYDEWGGMYQEGLQGLYVNVGIGFVGLPFRFGAWPEITVITLRR
ncbi:MAG: metallophosphoesterase [Bacteroidaceae bacterium]|nr:metallophosphoesterase [Bacteroidaceae bacterium]